MNIRAARADAGLTQVQLAERIGVTSFMAISRWERGEHKPSDESLIALSIVLEREVAWFYTDHAPHPNPRRPRRISERGNAVQLRCGLCQEPLRPRQKTRMVDGERCHRACADGEPESIPGWTFGRLGDAA